MTTCTEKASSGVNGIALHFVFDPPVKWGSKSYGCKKPGDETLHVLKNKYQHLKVLIIDAISMIQRKTFQHLDLALQAIKQDFLPFGEVSLLVVLDFLQLTC